MEEFLRVLARGAGVEGRVAWREPLEPGSTVVVRVPYAAVRVSQGADGVEAYGEITAAYSTAGLAFMGKLVAGELVAGGEPGATIFWAPAGSWAAVLVPTAYMFLGVAVHLAYDVDLVEVPGCGSYWRVVPLPLVVPLYGVSEARYDLLGETVDGRPLYEEVTPLDAPGPAELEAFTYAARRLHAATLGAGAVLLYEERSLVEGVASEEHLGMIVLNPYKPWLEAAAASLAAGDEELLGALEAAAAAYAGYTHVTLGGGVLLVFKVEAPPGEVVHVYKYALPVYAEGYRDAGVAPAMYYEVAAGPGP